MKELVIIGAGSAGLQAAQIAYDINQIEPKWDVLGFLDQDEQKIGRELHGLQVLGDLDWCRDHPDVPVVVAIGKPTSKWQVSRTLLGFGHRSWASLTHPRAWLGRNVQIGVGSVS